MTEPQSASPGLDTDADRGTTLEGEHVRTPVAGATSDPSAPSANVLRFKRGSETAALPPLPHIAEPPASPPTPHPLGTRLAATGLRKAYGGVAAVDGVDLAVAEGEVVGLLGRNGAGKTTCFSMLVGLVEADVGEVTLGGIAVTDLPMHRRARLGLGYLPQEASAFRGLTVAENLDAVLEGLGLAGPKRRQRRMELIHQFGLESRVDVAARKLSGGERRRLELARALAAAPRFLLLDEPFASLDPVIVADLARLIRHLADEGLGVLITDHNVHETLRLVDRAYVIDRGRVLAEGTPTEVVADPHVRADYLGQGFQL